ncbi:hypothetical protein AB0J83_15200 [Actinoplanes sp. NPDC049596]|uniref:hypothetical protein n=1 Tax=unclassified Actinoplanes TaxID=2626549 RepID=UPI0034431045
MTDLDTFRDELRGPADGRPPALDDIIGAGRRLRARRRFAGATVAAVVVAAVVSTVTWWPAQTPAPGGAWPAAAVDAEGSWGQAVSTGIRQDDREIVVTAFHNENPAYPDIKFGVRACAAAIDGKLGTCVNTFDDVPPDNSPGFHSIELPANVEYIDFPAYGYYVGPAETITATSRGRKVTAKLVPWSEDPNVVLFWFPLEQVYQKADKNDPAYQEGKVTKGQLPDLTGLTAQDAAGRTLPVGKPFIIG